ncbi:HD domain-containing protein [Anaerosporobacter faecicola]|uniref:HD domain-containing protein n=1 Tax=Anaerosporobacter faecicola TaxID=2718714 RepID=UPI00143AEEB3|nr:HD domain-containing protein [Anaerosporobacter faecicola]
MERLEKQMNFLMEVDKLKEITRQTYISSGKRLEDDAEHSWSLALMVALLSEHANEKIDVAKTMLMVLIHDIVEIDAGDTYAYDDAGNLTKRAREVAAADRIFAILPEDQGIYLRSLWEEFEEGKTPEAKFALTVDKVQPITLNDHTEGRAWREHEVHIDKIQKRNEHTAEGSEALWKYAKRLIDKNVEIGNIKK